MSDDRVVIPDPHRTRIKVCGLTRDADVDAACEAGVDYVGFILYSGSSRHVSIPRARMLVDRLTNGVTPVLVMVNPDQLDVTAIRDHFTATDVPFVLQFHGTETVAEADKISKLLGRAYWRAAGVPTHRASLNTAQITQALINYADPFVGSSALLLDSEVAAAKPDPHHPNFGGTGQTFDWSLVNWSLLKQSAASQLVLSGGLTAANVTDGIKQVQPWAVDVSTGVEKVYNGRPQRGVKDAEKIQQFVAAVRHADLELNAA
jgi:phosphoribosylanthranilate isomerase